MPACLTSSRAGPAADLCFVSEVANGTGAAVPGLCHSYDGGCCAQAWLFSRASPGLRAEARALLLSSSDSAPCLAMMAAAHPLRSSQPRGMHILVFADAGLACGNVSDASLSQRA